MDIKSLKEKMQGMEEKITASDAEIVALSTACEDYKVSNEAVKADLEAANKAMEASATEHSETVEAFKAEVQEKDESLVAVTEDLEQMKANMELSPVATIIGGQEPVVDGAVEGDEVDHVAVMNKLETSAERIAYYRANQAIIDAL